MKQSSLQLLKALFTGNNYHRIAGMRIVLFAILLCGMSNTGFGQIAIVTLSTPSPVASGNACPGATDVNVYAFTLSAPSGCCANNEVFDISFTPSGTATLPGDIIQYRLWRNSGGGTGVLLASTITNIFVGLAEVIAPGTVTNYWITADITASPTINNTIAISPMTPSDITVDTGPVLGSGGAEGTQTIRALPTVGGLTAGPSPICGGTNLTLTATGGTTGTGALVSYNWSGPGGYSASSPTSPHIYATPTSGASGVYSVTVTYPGAGCTSIPHASAAVTVNPQPVLPATMNICDNVPVATTTLNSGVAGGVWSSSVSAVATIEPTTGIVWPSMSTGSTSVMTQVAAGGCTASTTITLAARPSAIHGPAGTGGSTQAVCTGHTITLSSGTAGGVWSSSFTNIATVVPAGPANVGTVTGGAIVGPGAAMILYTNPVNGCDTTITVNVNPIPSPITGSIVVCMGSTDTLRDITPLGTWGSSAILTATVTPGPGAGGGIVYGVNAGGPINITYTLISTGCYVTHSVTVNPVPAPITGNNIVCTGQGTTVSDITPGGVWSSSILSVASMQTATTPSVIAGVAGSTFITYSLTTTGCTASLLMTVNQQPGPIGGPNQVCAGNTILLTDAVGGGTWSTNNSAIAIVGSLTGVVYGQYGPPVPQVATISYDLTSCIAVSYPVTVNYAPGPITGVPNVCVGFTTILSDTTAGGVWTNSGPTSVATVTSGVADTVFGVSQGFIIDTYTLVTTGCFDTMVVLVYPNPAPITGPNNVCAGAKVTLSDATPLGTWSSDTLAIAQVVDSSGVVTGITAGHVNISYTLATGCYATIPFTVNPIVNAAVTISHSPAGVMCAGTSETFTANPVNGGIPTYQWYKFVSPIAGATNATYTYTPVNGDLLSVLMATHFSCVFKDTVLDSLILDVYPVNSGPIVNITSVPATDTATFYGQVFTFFANVTWGGTAPAYQWYMNRLPIPGATLSSYSTPVYQNDSFFCRVTGTTPCNPVPTQGQSNPIYIYVSYLGVNPVSVATSDLVLFPNPGNGNIVLSGTVNVNSNNDINIEVSDMLGHMVYRGKTTPQNGAVREQINLSNLPAGAYILHVNSEALNQVFRFIISK